MMYSPALEAARKMVCGPGTLVVLVKAQLELLQPFDLLLPVICSTLGGNNALDYGASILVEVIPPVAIGLGSEVHEIVCVRSSRHSNRSACLDKRSSGGHVRRLVTAS